MANRHHVSVLTRTGVVWAALLVSIGVAAPTHAQPNPYQRVDPPVVAGCGGVG